MASRSGAGLKLYTVEDLAALPEPSWLIEGVLPRNALVVLYGAPASYKSFVALSQALSVAAGHDWDGRRTVKADVLYVAAEGHFGLKRRVSAYLQEHGIEANKIRFLGEPFNLMKEGEGQRVSGLLRAANFQPDLIILDTLARMMVGGDENAAEDMAAAIRNIDELKRETSATVIVIHHTVKGKVVERGSGALRGAADVMVLCKKEQTGLVSLNCDKMKEAEEFKPILLRLKCVELGGSQSSLAIASTGEVVRLDFDSVGRTGAGALRKQKALGILQAKFPEGATHSEWKEAYTSETRKSSSDFARALKDLQGIVRYDVDEKRYYAPQPDDGVSVRKVSK